MYGRWEKMCGSEWYTDGDLGGMDMQELALLWRSRVKTNMQCVAVGLRLGLRV